MREDDWPAVRGIYREGLATGHATFEAEVPDWERFTSSRLPAHRLVAEAPEGGILGWAAVSAVSARPVYAGVVEHSVYVAPKSQGRGIGRALLTGLAQSTETAGIWTIQSGIFPETTASLQLPEATGFRIVGVRQGIGRMTYGPLAGHWRDVIMIERRSTLAGC